MNGDDLERESDRKDEWEVGGERHLIPAHTHTHTLTVSCKATVNLIKHCLPHPGTATPSQSLETIALGPVLCTLQCMEIIWRYC